MNQLEIEAFVMVVETGSLSKAAEKLYTSQSTISSRLSTLENELDMILLSRGKGIKEVQLTPKGLEFLSYANRYLSTINEIYKWKENPLTYNVKISMPHSLCAYLFLDFFYENIENVKFTIFSHWNVTIYSMLNSRQLDLGLVSRPFNSKNLITIPFFLEQMVFIYNQDYSDYSDDLDIKNLDVKNEIYLDWGPDFEIWHNSLWSNINLPKVTVDSGTLIYKFLSSKNSWCVVPICLAKFLKKESNNKIKYIQNEKFPKRQIYLVKQMEQNIYEKKVINNLLDKMTAYIKDSPFIMKEVK